MAALALTLCLGAILAPGAYSATTPSPHAPIGQNVTVRESETATLTCKGDFDASLALWEKEGYGLLTVSDIIIDSSNKRLSARSDDDSSTLTIKNVEMADKGYYICKRGQEEVLKKIRLEVSSEQASTLPPITHKDVIRRDEIGGSSAAGHICQHLFGLASALLIAFSM